MERTLVLIKPDAMIKKLAGNIINDLYNLNLRMIGLKLVNVRRELAEQHYSDIKDKHGKEIFEKLIKHITGEFHNNENVIAIVYQGKNAVQKVREVAGKTNPEEADYNTIRGKFGRIYSSTDCFENVIHASDSKETAEKEIKLWFRDDELVE